MNNAAPLPLRSAHSSSAPEALPDLVDQPSFPHFLVVAVVHLAAVAALFQPSWAGFAWLLAGHVLTGLGVSVGYHRLLAHKGFRAGGFVRGVFALLGTLSLQGGPLTWSAYHRAHHAQTDQEGDPHSSSRGFWYCHMGWIMKRRPNGYRRSRINAQMGDLEASAWLRFLDRYQLGVNLAAAGIFLAATGRLDWMLWAFPLRIIALWHATWFVNSVGHGAGAPREYAGDTSRNVWWVALITYGEGWHRNHHGSPKSWSFRRQWWQVDPGAVVISALRGLRLAR